MYSCKMQTSDFPLGLMINSDEHKKVSQHRKNMITFIDESKTKLRQFIFFLLTVVHMYTF